ncbi:MAG: HNH endonuclease signature motif containing protein [Ilumatobacteraceae bacterium]
MDTLCRPAPDTCPPLDEPRSVADLADSLCAGAANLTAYEYRWLRDLAEFDRRRGWLQWEQASCAAWLSWQVGLDARSAREKVRVARALAEMPHVAAAMERGHLCYSKVRAITRVATPATEESLVDMALVSTTAQLERIVAGTRRALAAVNGDAAQRWAGRRLDHRIDDDGMVMVSIRLTADDAAVFLAAVEQFVAEVEPAERLLDSARSTAVDVGESESAGSEQAVSATGRAMFTSERVPVAARRADAAVALAQAAVSSGTSIAAQASLAAQPLVTLHVDCRASTPAVVHVNRCEPESVECSVDAPQALSPVSVGVVAAGRHCCDAMVEVATHHADGSVTMSPRVGVVRGRQRRAVLARDRHCQFPGCTRSAGVEIHHLVHRAHGGGNEADNLVVLCRFHHHRLHDERWSTRRTSGGLVFSSPDGRVVGQPSSITGAAQTVLDLDRTAADGRSRWAGDPLHLVEALGFLASAAAVAERTARGRFAALAGREARRPRVGAA